MLSSKFCAFELVSLLGIFVAALAGPVFDPDRGSCIGLGDAFGLGDEAVFSGVLDEIAMIAADALAKMDLVTAGIPTDPGLAWSRWHAWKVYSLFFDGAHPDHWDRWEQVRCKILTTVEHEDPRDVSDLGYSGSCTSHRGLFDEHLHYV